MYLSWLLKNVYIFNKKAGPSYISKVAIKVKPKSRSLLP